jgi:hypothetical protein
MTANRHDRHFLSFIHNARSAARKQHAPVPWIDEALNQAEVSNVPHACILGIGDGRAPAQNDVGDQEVATLSGCS